MPSMGNSPSPNNVAATKEKDSDLYQGIMNLTMTGTWNLNLQLKNPAGDILKGEAVSSATGVSSIFFQVIF
jgi:hypothetical protein